MLCILVPSPLFRLHSINTFSEIEIKASLTLIPVLELVSRNVLQEFTGTIRKFGLRIDDIEINPAYANSGLGVYTIKFKIIDDGLKKKTHGEIIEVLSALDCVHYVEEIQ